MPAAAHLMPSRRPDIRHDIIARGEAKTVEQPVIAKRA
jgi:hypothetical protein